MTKATASFCIKASIVLGFAISMASAVQAAHRPSTGNVSQINLPLLAKAAAHSFETKGRTGSHRVGGTNSHGKRSHYVGGRK